GVQHGPGQHQHQAHHQGVTVAPVQLGHVVEVHAVHAHDEGERDEDGADHGEQLHHLAHAHVQPGVVGVLQVGQLVAQHGDAFGDVHGVVLQVVDVAARSPVDQLAGDGVHAPG